MSTPKPPFLIGIDGGGTGCRVAIATPDLKIITRANGGPANAFTNRAGTIRNVLDALGRAARDAGLSDTEMRGLPAHAGLAGVIAPHIADAVKAALPLTRLTVTEDRETMLAGALGDRDGSLAAIGTGSFFARQSGGGFRSIGGWGFALSDEASGAWLGRALLRRTLQAQDGVIADEPLLAQILQELGGPTGIVTFAAKAGASDYAALAPRITADPHGTGAALMAEGAVQIVQALSALGHPPGAPLCLSGGLGPHYAGYLPEALAMALVSAEGSALDGALRLAARQSL
ncbi:BadF/BadG/BcrA/BcrD ATPase family protein [Primorskyibacter sp. 2E107]|uniref:BadF/BadG/BcrA/BcrD ATPase family protein n=1 Tax=Primorskyibacter sp. 2E107 TaxID=3403458 RepID=UPI003AF75E6F